MKGGREAVPEHPVQRHLPHAVHPTDRFDAANDWFERAVAERSPMVVYLATDPRLAPLRATPRFRALLGSLRLSAAESSPVSQ